MRLLDYLSPGDWAAVILALLGLVGTWWKLRRKDRLDAEAKVEALRTKYEEEIESVREEGRARELALQAKVDSLLDDAMLEKKEAMRAMEKELETARERMVTDKAQIELMRKWIASLTEPKGQG